MSEEKEIKEIKEIIIKNGNIKTLNELNNIQNELYAKINDITIRKNTICITILNENDIPETDYNKYRLSNDMTKLIIKEIKEVKDVKDNKDIKNIEK